MTLGKCHLTSATATFATEHNSIEKTIIIYNWSLHHISSVISIYRVFEIIYKNNLKLKSKYLVILSASVSILLTTRSCQSGELQSFSIGMNGSMWHSSHCLRTVFIWRRSRRPATTLQVLAEQRHSRECFAAA